MILVVFFFCMVALQVEFREAVESGAAELALDAAGGWDEGQGSIMIVVATDAPLSSRNLERLASRAIMGLSRTGSFAGNGSGDYVIAFSTAESVRRARGQVVHTVEDLDNGRMSALFQGVVEATEEAIYNSLFKATTVAGVLGTAEALPIDRLITADSSTKDRISGMSPRPDLPRKSAPLIAKIKPRLVHLK